MTLADVGPSRPRGRRRHAVRGRLTPERLRELVRWLRSCGVEELELAVGAERLYIRREDGLPTPAPPPPEPPAAPLVIGAPAVGLFHRGLEAGAPPVVAEGAVVRAGQVLGIVEVLRMPHPVEAPADGRVRRFLAESGQAVEYGQPLVELEPLPPAADDDASARGA